MITSLKSRWGLTVSLVLFVFAVMVTAMLLSVLIIVILHNMGVLPFLQDSRPEQDGVGGILRVIVVMILSSIVLGVPTASFFSRIALRPIRKVVEATHQVAEGDFSVRVDIKGIHELEELSLSFNRMTVDLASIETLRSDFINNFSHELKTPIASVRGFAKLLKDGQLTEEEKREYLDIIIVEAERLSQLSTNILELSKYENTEIIPDKTLFRLDEQIRRAVLITEPQWATKGININVEMDEVLFEGNEDLTQQIWLNLLDNAIKFSRSDSMVDLRLVHVHDGVLFTIQDSGIGMDEATMGRIFDKFFRGESSHAGVGNGLGLTIVKRIVDLCGGKIEVSSEPEKGSVFTVFLPG